MQRGLGKPVRCGGCQGAVFWGLPRSLYAPPRCRNWRGFPHERLHQDGEASQHGCKVFALTFSKLRFLYTLTHLMPKFSCAYPGIGIGIVRNPLFPHPLTKTPGSFWIGTISMISVRAQYSISASQPKFKSLCP